jgi:hypothetical protein
MDNNSLANQYADWIVKNADKKGSPEFNSVADAYKETLQLLRGGSKNEETSNQSINSGDTLDEFAKKEIPQQENTNVVPETKVISFKIPKFITEANAGEIDRVVMPKLEQVESGGVHIDPKTGKLLRSNKGALGITGVMPTTGEDPGYGVQPLQNDTEKEYIRFSRDYFKALLIQFDGDTEKALAAYNWGPVAFKNHLTKHGPNWKNNLPKETRDYIEKVMNK